MSDITQGQDAPLQAKPAPDVDDLFPKQDVDTLFPADYKPSSQPVRNVSPIQDMLFSDPGRSHARILDAFGYGFKQDWGAGSTELSETDEALRKAGIYNDYAKGQRNIVKAMNEAVMRPAVAALLSAKSVASGVFHGAQEAVAQAGAEAGAPSLGRELASIPEAFPAGLHQVAGIPHLPEPIARAKSLDTIGAGEAGYFGTKPVEAEPASVGAESAKVQDVGKPEALSGQDSEAGPSPVAQPGAPAPIAAEAPDVHAVARQIAPQTFSEFDTLAQKKDTFRRWISELREVRDQTTAENAPHGAAITDLEAKLKDTTPRLAKKYQAQIDPMVAERDAYIAEHSQVDSADMQKVRRQLMETDYRMRDLAGDVAKAYREAEGRMPAAEAIEAPAAVEATPAEITAHEAKPTEVLSGEVPAANATAVEPVAPTAAAPAAAPTAVKAEALIKGADKASEIAGRQAIKPDTPEEAVRLPIAHAPSIVADVSQKLVAAGRPAEEAQAAAQVVAAYWETRAQRFNGAKGTAAEMYAAEAPEIKAGKEKTRVRQPEMAQTTDTQNGRIRLREGARNTITLMKKADASTFIHETGHDWLDRMLGDARDADAPASLKADSDTVLKWLGVDSPDGIKTRHHEKFARGFETYMMEGRAPTQALANVFAKFKAWLTTIYRTIASLKSPISDDIRAVFDRFLTTEPRRTVIAPERPSGAGLAEKHEALTETTPPERSHEVANTIEAERDSHAAQTLVKASDHDTRLTDTGTEAEGRASRGAQPAGDADASGPLDGRSEEPGGSGTLGAGGSEAAGEGAGARQGSARLNKPATPLLQFIASRGGISAGDALLSDLRQSLGAKNHYVPGHGQLIRTPKQLSTAARKAGRSAAMSIDRAREAAIEAGYLPEGASITEFLDAIDAEVRGKIAAHERPTDPAELAHAEHNFLEGVNDVVKEAGGAELSDTERTRALELWRQEGLNDPVQIIERLALEADDAEIERGAPERAEGIPGWDTAAPGWDTFDERPDASGARGGAAAGQPEQPGGGAARLGGEAEKLHPLDANAPLPRSETRLIDKAGNIRLDNLGTPEDVSAVIRATANELQPYDEAITRGRIPDAEVVKLADALGMDASKLSERHLGRAFNAEQIVAARKLLIQSAQTVRDAMGKAATGVEADVLAYAEAKSRHLMIQEHVSGVTAEAGRALRAFRALEGQQDAAVITGFLQDATGKTLYQLQKEAQLGLQLETPAQVSKFVADSAKPTYKDMALEAWMAALLSGPRTHVANVLGNTISSIWRPVETATAAAIGKARNLVTGTEDRVLIGEAAAELFGMVNGSREGLVAARKAFQMEEPQLTATRQAEKSHPKALPGIFGSVVRTPLRMLGAEDEFFKAVAFRGEIYRQAYVKAVGENLAPELMRQRVAELAMSPSEEMVAGAKKVADYQTFQTALGKVGRAVQTFSNSHALAKVVIPFVRTPLNLLKYAAERSPLGLFAQEVRDNLSGKNGAPMRDTQTARIALGTMVGVVAFEMASQGLITGGGPADKGKKSVMQADGWQDYSVKIGDMYYRYNRLDPFSVTLGVAADAYEIMTAAGAEHPDKEHLPALVFAAISKNILNRAALQGLSDMIQASSDPERYGKNYVKGLVGSVIPAISAQAAQTLDPTVREARTVVDNLKARIPGLSQALFAKRDVWGEPILREGGLGPDIASPIAEARLKNDPVNQALIKANYFPSSIERKIRGIDLTDQQHDDFARIAGRTAKLRLNAIVNMPGFNQMPESTRKELMTSTIRESREAARSIILMQNPEIITKANAAKTAKLRGEPVH